MLAQNQDPSASLLQTGTSPIFSRLSALLEQGNVEEFNKLRPKGEIDLSRIQIPKDTNLKGVNLTDAILIGAKLVSVNLSGAILTNANFTQADLAYAQLKDVSAKNANFDRATLNHSVGSNGDFTDANFANAHLMRATYESADFTGAKMQLSLLNSACFRNSDFTNANLSSARMKDASFEKGCLVNTQFKRADITSTNFSFANLSSSSFKLALGESPKFRSACMHLADLTNSVLVTPDFSAAFVKEMKHSFGDKRDEFLKGAYADQDADPKKFMQSKQRSSGSGLIMNIPGTDGELLAQVMRDIDRLTGLEEVKGKIKKMIGSFQMNELRRQLGEPTVKFGQHLAFIGEPGVGKTTIGRHWGKVLKAFGYLEKGHVVEVPGRELIVGKIGQSEEKTREYIHKAMGGILFIDEAPLLASDSEQDFGSFVIGTVNHYMTNYAGKFAVIIAGQKKGMIKLFNMEDGLLSRISDMWEFPGYDSGQLMEILGKGLNDLNRTCSQEFLAGASALTALTKLHYDDKFGNARFIHLSLINKANEQQDQRLIEEGILELTDAAQQRSRLRNLELSDLPSEEILGIKPVDLVAQLKDATWEFNGSELRIDNLPSLYKLNGSFPKISPDFIKRLYENLNLKDNFKLKDNS